VHAELTLRRGPVVAHGTVELLMRRAGLRGVTGRPKWVRVRPDSIAGGLVDRALHPLGADQLRVTDTTEQLTGRQGVLRGRARCPLAAWG
jgi:putative transposase